MRRLHDSATLACTPERFWSVFLDEEFSRVLLLEELRCKSFRMLELTATSRKLLVVPNIPLPGPLQRIVGDSLSYEEHGALDRAAGLWRWQVVPPPNAPKAQRDLVSASGSLRITAEGAERIRRVDEASIEAHLFGLGGLVESTVEKEVLASWSKERALLERWLRDRPAPASS